MKNKSMSDWYCRYCSHYTNSNRCTCDDPKPETTKKLERERKRKIQEIKNEIKILQKQLKELTK